MGKPYSFLLTYRYDGKNPIWSTGNRALLAINFKYAVAGERIFTNYLDRCKNLSYRYSYVWQKSKLERNRKMGIKEELKNVGSG